MNLKAKEYVQQQKQAAQNNLSARIALLESKGAAPAVIQKDVVVRKFKADIRASRRRLAGVAAQEKRNIRKAEEKAARAAAGKQAAGSVQPESGAAKPQKKEKKARQKKSPAASRK